MIFCRQGIPCIFIHNKKTGGNTIQKYILDKEMSIDQIRISNHQDGIDRFDLIGKYTKFKHQSLSTYYKFCPKLTTLDVFTCVRHPVDRLLSLYYSPHRHFTYDSQKNKWILPKEPEFNMSDFRSLVAKTSSCTQMLSVSFNKQFYIPAKITILRTENLTKDCQNYLGFDIKKSRNVSPYSQFAKKLRGNTQIHQIIADSHHIDDAKIFYGC